jgi:hypothetical protein
MALHSGAEVSGRDLRVNRCRPAIALGLAVPALVLGGCSGEPEPRIAPSESPSPATSSESTSADPSPSNPVATVRAWVDAQNDALTTGDTEQLKVLSADPCQACDDFIEPIERVYRQGGYFRTEGWKVVAAKTRPGSHNPFVVNAGIVIAGGKTLTKEGAKPVVYGPDRRIVVFKVDEQRSRLVVSFLGFLS